MGVLVPSHVACKLAQCVGIQFGNEMDYYPTCLGPNPFWNRIFQSVEVFTPKDVKLEKTGSSLTHS